MIDDILLQTKVVSMSLTDARRATKKARRGKENIIIEMVMMIVLNAMMDGYEAMNQQDEMIGVHVSVINPYET